MKRKYEGMFLFDPAVTPDWEACRTEIDRLMGRNEGRLIAANKWDERRLAYEIRGRKRGIYGLTYFEMPPSSLQALQRDTNLSESILRCLILAADHLTEEEMQEVVATPASAEGEEGEQERSGGPGGRGGRTASAPQGSSEASASDKQEQEAPKKAETSEETAGE